MEFRLAKIEEKLIIEKYIEEAKKNLKNMGIDQWQDGYPNGATIKDDISKDNYYVLLDQGEILAGSALIKGKEASYEKIYQGAWLSQREYLTIHRTVVNSSKYSKGYASRLFKMIEKLARDLDIKSIRVDTHRKNKPMLRVIEKAGFKYCGIIFLEDGSERLAFEKLL